MEKYTLNFGKFLQYDKKSVIIENNGVSVVYMSGRLINL